MHLAQSFIVAKKEDLLRLHDGAAERRAVLIPAQLRLDWVEVVGSIEYVVAKKLVNRSVELVGTRLGDEVDGRAGRFTESRIVDVGLDLEFLDGVGRGLNGESAKGQVPGIDPVDERVVARRTGAVGGVSGFAKGDPRLEFAKPPLLVPTLVSGTVPGTRLASAPKRRTLSGRSTVSRWPITVPTLALLVSTSGAALVTSTVESTEPTCRWTSTRAFWFTNKVMPVSFSVLNPGASTAMEYSAGTRLGKL